MKLILNPVIKLLSNYMNNFVLLDHSVLFCKLSPY